MCWCNAVLTGFPTMSQFAFCHNLLRGTIVNKLLIFLDVHPPCRLIASRSERPRTLHSCHGQHPPCRPSRQTLQQKVRFVWKTCIETICAGDTAQKQFLSQYLHLNLRGFSPDLSKITQENKIRLQTISCFKGYFSCALPLDWVFDCLLQCWIGGENASEKNVWVIFFEFVRFSKMPGSSLILCDI